MKEKLMNRKLMIYFTTGIDEDGKIINKTKTFNNIRLDSEESNLSAFATNYSALSSYAYKKTLVADYFEINSSELA